MTNFVYVFAVNFPIFRQASAFGRGQVYRVLANGGVVLGKSFCEVHIDLRQSRGVGDFSDVGVKRCSEGRARRREASVILARPREPVRANDARKSNSSGEERDS